MSAGDINEIKKNTNVIIELQKVIMAKLSYVDYYHLFLWP